jgi:hypothetical protein
MKKVKENLVSIFDMKPGTVFKEPEPGHMFFEDPSKKEVADANRWWRKCPNHLKVVIVADYDAALHPDKYQEEQEEESDE